MVIVNSRALDLFALKHADARISLGTWKKMTRLAMWKKPQDLLSTFPTARMIKNNRARFEIAHNKYRLIGEVIYDSGQVILRFIGTHAEYDKIDPSTI